MAAQLESTAAIPRSSTDKRLLSVGLACIDIINSVAAFPAEDECVRTTAQRRVRGGNASNSAVVAAACGATTTWLGTAAREGSPDAEFVTADLARCNVAALPAFRDVDAAPTSYVIASEATGSRTIARHRAEAISL